MDDLEEIRLECLDLTGRLQGTVQWPALRTVYLDLSTVVGRLQGLVSARVRGHEESNEARLARESLERFKAQTRQVGLDIRLASEPALLLGLQTALETATETIEHLRRLEQ